MNPLNSYPGNKIKKFKSKYFFIFSFGGERGGGGGGILSNGLSCNFTRSVHHFVSFTT